MVRLDIPLYWWNHYYSQHSEQISYPKSFFISVCNLTLLPLPFYTQFLGSQFLRFVTIDSFTFSRVLHGWNLTVCDFFFFLASFTLPWCGPWPSGSVCCGCDDQIHTDCRSPMEKKGRRGHSLRERAPTPAWTGF